MGCGEFTTHFHQWTAETLAEIVASNRPQQPQARRAGYVALRRRVRRASYTNEAREMSQCDIELDWTAGVNGAWFVACEVPQRMRSSPSPQKP
jgi:hypothetical protein